MDILYEENSVGVFILVTLILGAGAAALTGRAIASTAASKHGSTLCIFVLIVPGTPARAW
jgi:hypothetical protein